MSLQSPDPHRPESTADRQAGCRRGAPADQRAHPRPGKRAADVDNPIGRIRGQRWVGFFGFLLETTRTGVVGCPLMRGAVQRRSLGAGEVQLMVGARHGRMLPPCCNPPSSPLWLCRDSRPSFLHVQAYRQWGFPGYIVFANVDLCWHKSAPTSSRWHST